MVDTNELTKGNYLNAETIEEGDIVRILDEGVIGTIEKNGVKKKVFNLNVECKGKSLIYTPGFKSIRLLQNIFGTPDSTQWIGKEFIVTIKDIESYGKEMKVIRPIPLEQKA